MKVTDLAKHRPDERHLEEQPLDGFIPAPRIGWHELARLVCEIKEDCPGFEQPKWESTGPVRIDDRRNLAVGIERPKFGRLLVVLAEVNYVRLIGQPDLFQHDRHLHAIRRRKGVKLQPVGMLSGPARGDRKPERSDIQDSVDTPGYELRRG